MKYLKPYNEEIKLSKEVAIELKDILQELEDDGFEIGVGETGVSILNKKSFLIDFNIVESILRLIEYLKMKNYTPNIIYVVNISSPLISTLSIKNIDDNGIYLNEDKSKKIDYPIKSIVVKFK